MNSTHEISCFKFDFSMTESHENAEKLCLLNIPDSNYYCCLNIQDWKDYEGYAAWIPPDSLVDTSRKEFDFLSDQTMYNENLYKDKQGRFALIRAKKLRGVVSYGLLVPVDTDDISDNLGIIHYNKPETIEKTSGNTVPVPGPNISTPRYDIDAFLKYGKRVFSEEETVYVTEKIDGCLHADTLITMGDGSEKPIQDIKIGDKVVCYDASIQEFKKSRVKSTFLKRPNKAQKWVRIKLENGKSITITENHLVLTTGGWVPAGKLTIDDDIVSL